RTRGLTLLGEVLPQVRRGPRVETALLQTLGGLLGGQRVGVARPLPQCPTEVPRAARTVTAPERGLGGLAGRGGDDNAVDGDLLDAPRRRAEHEALADATLVDHLFVELTDAHTVGQEHAEQSAVGNRAAALHRDALRAFTGAYATLHAVP